MSDSSPRVGLIGTGFMARKHTAAWHTLGAKVLVHSRSAERGRQFAAEHGAVAVDDLGDLLDQVDVVDVCTPTDTHEALVLRAAAAGRHVICEKPLARTPAQGLAMIEACRTAGVGLLPAQVLRFFPAYVLAHDAVRAGRIGALEQLQFSRENAIPGAETWFADVERSGGVLVDLAIHDLDFARWVAGDVTQVVGRTQTGPHDGLPIRSSATLTHASGAVSEVTAVWDVPGTPLHSSFELVGDEGVLRFDSAPTPVLRDGSGRVLFEDTGADDPFADQLAEFVATFAGSAEPRITAEDGLVALALALAGTQSADSGVPVDPGALLRPS